MGACVARPISLCRSGGGRAKPQGTLRMRASQQSVASWAVVLLASAACSAVGPCVAGAATYYVRQTVGDDSNDGLTPATAWKHFSRLSPAMNAGDTAFVGPGSTASRLRSSTTGPPRDTSPSSRTRPVSTPTSPAGRGHGGGLRARGRQSSRPPGRRASTRPTSRTGRCGSGRDGRPRAALRERPDHARESGGEGAAGGHRGEAAVELVLRRYDAGADAAYQRRAAAGRARDGAHPPRRRHLHPGEARRDRGRLHVPAHAGRGGAASPSTPAMA